MGFKSFRGALALAARGCRARVVVVALLGSLLGPGVVNAATTPGYGVIGTFGSSGASQGQLSAPKQVAVDGASGNVLIADSGNARVQVFAPSGTTAAYLTEFNSGLVTPFGVAVDQSTGDVYVSDPGAGAILKFDTDAAATPTYTADALFTSPAQGSGPGNVGDFASALAVDPATHDLLVADRGNERVSRYTSTGTFLSSFDGSTSAGGVFVGLQDVAVSSSTIYVVDANGEPQFGAPTRVERFDATGASLGPLDTSDNPVVAAVDPARDRAVTAGNTTSSSTPPVLSVFSGAEAAAQADFPSGTAGSVVTGLAIDGGTSKRLYAVTDQSLFGTGILGVQVFGSAPGVAVDAVTTAGTRTAEVSGLVNPDGTSTTAHFEYSNDGGATWSSSATTFVGAGSSDVTVSTTLTGLRPNTSYYVRLVADNGEAVARTSARTFATAESAPDAIATPATDKKADSATLNGFVTPLGLQASYHFEYGTTTDYGQRVPANVDGVAGKGVVRRAVTERITGLTAGTTYHVRLVAMNSAGTTYSNDVAFTTASPGVVSRVYEMVSPVDKGGIDVADQATGYQARSDGGAIVYTTKASTPGSQGSPIVPRYAAVRTASNWITYPLDPPLGVTTSGAFMTYTTLAVSADQTKALVITRQALTPDAIQGNGNMYIRSVGTDTYRLIATSADPAFIASVTTVGGQTAYLGATADLGTIVFNSPAALVPGAQGSNNAYMWSEARGLELASVLPNGQPATGAVDNSTNFLVSTARNQLSADGQRFYFSVNGTSDGSDGLYLRSGGHTVGISVSQRTGDPATVHPAVFDGASSDGRYVVFTSLFDSTPLTDDAPVATSNTYRYDVQTGQLTYLTHDVNIVENVSDDTSYVYIVGAAALTSDATGAGPWLYAVHDGDTKLIGELPYASDGVTPGTPTTATSSPDGRYFAFTSVARLTGYDNTGSRACAAARKVEGGSADVCSEVYLYDAAANTLVCPSCRSDGKTALGDASLGIPDQPYLSRYYPRPVLADGTVYFDSPDPLVAADINGRQDVYSYDGDVPVLLSPGTADANARIRDVTPDGSNVFFITNERLVGQDVDDAADVYDARIGGGLPGQGAASAPHECGGVECAEPASGPTSSPPAPSEGASSPGFRVTAAAKAEVSITKTTITSSQLRITVRATSRGRIRVSGSRLTATVRNVRAPGSYTVKVPLTRRARAAFKKLNKHKKLKVTYKVSLTPPFGKRVSVKGTRTLGK